MSNEETLQLGAVSPKPVTDDDLKNALKSVALESPSYVYTSPEWMEPGTDRCYYVHHARGDEGMLACGCMVGVALHSLGVPLAALKEWEACSASAVLMEFFPNASDEVRAAYTTAQIRQDRGLPWGVAIRGLDL
ncbi:hypothetical protein RM863_11600 [Streptomyces sp. DSM 41014]|uniref:Uncharacterized protein n=1 Tax=Streptomyces hintoniae TaxID=3075521 RepID=A0ABU2UHM9_9ACTN|nr:hypothetical protein [Streptomyces sp. DSM 41014]MDT0472772.1 hypothetical protein [Streptomyces sp. DSM 41014]